MSWQLIIDIIGWVGSIEVILAYGLNSYQKIKSDSLLYQTLNLTGGIFLIINTIYYGAYPSTAINVVWVVIATIAIGSLIRKK
ncbi:MAG: hypothetical protein RIC80_13535 [Cyclobacteriaceae bacterium]